MAQQTPVDELPKAFDRGILIDGSSLEGFSRIEESDLRAKPDPRTFRVLPWKYGGQVTGVVICDVIAPDGSPYDGDPRGILRRVLSDPAFDRKTVYLGPELEFFYFRASDDPTPLDTGQYFELVPDQVGIDLRTRTIEALQALGIVVEVGHHEVAASQHEIDLRYQEALVMADTVLLYRWVVKQVAAMNGVYATFMPKPIAGVNGSGMHVHQSIFEDGRNLFFQARDSGPYGHLSSLGQHYLAGLLTNVPSLTLLFNQWVNSYKRLVPGYEAPVYVCAGNRNRSALVRIPGYEPGHEVATRLELRSADPSCNPYLAFAGMIVAGLDGIRRFAEPPPPVEQDVYGLSPEVRDALDLAVLPGDLGEAMRVFDCPLAFEILGAHTFEKLLENKRAELDRWRLAVTDFERREYLPVL